MIKLEQILQLEIRVKKAVEVIKSLRAQKEDFQRQIAGLESDLEKLRNEATERSSSEEQLEMSLQGVIDILDEVDQTAEEAIPESLPGNDDESRDESSFELEAEELPMPSQEPEPRDDVAPSAGADGREEVASHPSELSKDDDSSSDEIVDDGDNDSQPEFDIF